MTEFRCPVCHRKLAAVEYGNVEIKCPRCHTVSSIDTHEVPPKIIVVKHHFEYRPIS